MSWNAEYVRTQLDRIKTLGQSGFASGLRAKLRKNDFTLCVLYLDICKSTTIESPTFERVRDALALVAATDVAARGGFVVEITDGLEAFYFGPKECVASAIALHGRRAELRERVLEPLLRSSTLDGDLPTVDFRLCLSLYPTARLASLVDDDSADDHKCAERILDRWRVARSRYANDESFLADALLLPLLLQDESFDGDRVDLRRLKGAPGENLEFWAQGFRPFSGSVGVPLSGTPPRAPGTSSPASLEEQLRDARQDRRRIYQEARGGLRDKHTLFHAYPLETPSAPRVGVRAGVVGDVNVDYVTTIGPDEMQVLVKGQHIQAQRAILKSLGGKGLLTAMALEHLDGVATVDLVAKLGVDLEMQYVLTQLKHFTKIRPQIFMSAHAATGTTLSIRMTDSLSAALTVTDKPNANSSLTREEAAHLVPWLAAADWLVVSGYCFLDGRRNLVLDLIAAVHGAGGNVAVELSPGRLLAELVGKDVDRREELSRALGSTDFVVYEPGPFQALSPTFEREVLDRVPHALRLQFESNAAQTRIAPGAGWRRWSIRDPEKAGKAPSGADSVGLMSRLLARHINEFFLRPRILLCSESPRRREILENVYGRGSVFVAVRRPHASPAAVPKKPWLEFSSGQELHGKLLASALAKAKADLLASVADHGAPLEGCRVAIASELAIVIDTDRAMKVLGRPDELVDPIGAARSQLELLSGSAHLAVTATVVVDLVQLRDGSRHWHPEAVARALAVAPPITSDECGEGVVDGLITETTVTFRKLDADEITEYLASGEWRTKAGSYALQGSGAYFIDEVDGAVTNVLGLPVVEVAALLARRGLHAS